MRKLLSISAMRQMAQRHRLTPVQKRDFKSIRVPFNEYEYNQLVKGAKLSGRSKLNFMRFAMLKLTAELKSEGLTYDD